MTAVLKTGKASSHALDVYRRAKQEEDGRAKAAASKSSKKIRKKKKAKVQSKGAGKSPMIAPKPVTRKRKVLKKKVVRKRVKKKRAVASDGLLDKTISGSTLSLSTTLSKDSSSALNSNLVKFPSLQTEDSGSSRQLLTSSRSRGSRSMDTPDFVAFGIGTRGAKLSPIPKKPSTSVESPFSTPTPPLKRQDSDESVSMGRKPMTQFGMPAVSSDSSDSSDTGFAGRSAGVGTSSTKAERKGRSRFSISSTDCSSDDGQSVSSLDSIDSMLKATLQLDSSQPAATASGFQRPLYKHTTSAGYKHTSRRTPPTDSGSTAHSHALTAEALKKLADGKLVATGGYFDAMEQFTSTSPPLVAADDSTPQGADSLLSMKAADAEMSSMHVMKKLVYDGKMDFYAKHLETLDRELRRSCHEHRFVCRLMVVTALEYLGLDPNDHRLVSGVDFYDYHMHAHVMGLQTAASSRSRGYSEMSECPSEMSDISRMSRFSHAKFDADWNELAIPTSRMMRKKPAVHETTIIEEVWEELHDPMLLDPCEKCGAINQREVSADCGHKHEHLCRVDSVKKYLREQLSRRYTADFRGLVALVHLGVDDRAANCPLEKVRAVFHTCVSRRVLCEKIRRYKLENEHLKGELEDMRADAEECKAELESTRRKLVRVSSRKGSLLSDDYSYVHGDEATRHSSRSSAELSPRPSADARRKSHSQSSSAEVYQRMFEKAKLHDMSTMGMGRCETPHHIQLDGNVSDEGTPAAERRFVHRSSMKFIRRREKVRRRASIDSSGRAYGAYKAKAPARAETLSRLEVDGGRGHGHGYDESSSRMSRMEDSKRTWKSYLERDTYIRQRYPADYKDRNSAWTQWTALLDSLGADFSTSIGEQSTSQIWSYIDFARMSLGRYNNWMWFPLKRRAEGFTDVALRRLAAAEPDSQAYDEESGILWCKKYGLLMDFNLLLFDKFVEAANLQDTLLVEHLVLSLATVNRVIRDVEDPAQFYLHTAARKGRKYLQFRCDLSPFGTAEKARDEWCDELEYQILIVRDLLRIPRVKMRVADGNGALWLPSVISADECKVKRLSSGSTQYSSKSRSRSKRKSSGESITDGRDVISKSHTLPQHGHGEEMRRLERERLVGRTHTLHVKDTLESASRPRGRDKPRFKARSRVSRKYH